ncbi:hypothetical protein M1563_00735 [Patescibacteria group bacterium]|nr:hypothetical protein [Patescibacteria group bacterium]MCL5410141.1 hypothetical protein [Patescibacteria group bacterium]
MAKQNQDINILLSKVQAVTKQKELDLSSDEDLSVAIMNLISIEEHLFFTSQKTGKSEYINLLDEVREMRKSLLKEIIKDYEGEVWCISKHLLAASMRLMEVGTKELTKKNKTKAEEFFAKAYQLYSLFWGINLKIVKLTDNQSSNEQINLINDHNNKTTKLSVLDKLGAVVQKAIDCCKE